MDSLKKIYKAEAGINKTQTDEEIPVVVGFTEENTQYKSRNQHTQKNEGKTSRNEPSNWNQRNKKRQDSTKHTRKQEENHCLHSEDIKKIKLFNYS